ncbi:TetR/AcrR family transcriptional regulator [Saccharothrix sp. NRRL B-16314]|uniref:TetR/AcrR family transcriptional regulator n=1 Tax=Saccharothrix sp. NRRL B-16314 TaxID=1463825 RepID=UPI00052535E9|nr:TetR/AcrR family transcriptional regulator [Saccharothrix sp. NRRL B-16314]
MSPRTPTGAAVLQTAVTEAIAEAVLAELAEHGYARLSMEAVAKRAGVGKSALYRRWPSKQEMATSVISEATAAQAPPTADTGSLRDDLRETVNALMAWLAHPLFSRILPDLVAEMARTPELGGVVDAVVCGPRRELAATMFRRAVERGELRADVDLEIALDLFAAAIYWRLTVRAAQAEPGYVDELVDTILRGIGP